MVNSKKKYSVLYLYLTKHCIHKGIIFVLIFSIQDVLEHAEPETVLPPVKMILPDMNVAIDMDQIEQVN